MLPPFKFNKGISKVDCMLYSVSVMAGLAIVFSGYHMNATDPSQAGGLNNYLDKIISRMDAVSGQLSAWGTIDIRKETNSF